MEFLLFEWLGKPAWMWLGFLLIVGVLLALDLGVLHRKQKEIGVRESLVLSAGYIVLGVSFAVLVWWQLGETAGIQYLTGFVVANRHPPLRSGWRSAYPAISYIKQNKILISLK